MNQVLRELHGLHAVIETEHARLNKYVVALEYHLYEASPPKEDANGLSASPRQKRRKMETLQGVLIVTVGCDSAWWSTCIQGPALGALIASAGQITSSSVAVSEPAELTEDQCQPFADKVRNAFRRQSIMVGVNKTAPKDTHYWKSIRLYIDPKLYPIQLKLDRLDDRLALIRSTNIVLQRTPYAPSANTSLKSATDDGETASLAELHALQRKLEATQQALREERHKYRSLLAAPSAANARAGRRPVVGLGPAMLPNASQRSQMLSQTPSSPSTGSRSRSGLPSSSSSASNAAGVSSDDFALSSDGPERVSQRTLSLVNPTRVRRADPSENDGFVGDDDEEE
ncbi:uncharacterized protein SPSC_05625 [Sporisorium scitamineum]|uniref:Uncharacterized protein n=1 Tax=Sporisorium scitamineum TaxID=49012 RepID=A0A127Z6J9_9BASI|nr:uncharacterized protein SPSC_05625 [Sporisorium scitamineum]